MVSFSSRPTSPLDPRGDLIDFLAASPRPAVVEYLGDERTELSGRVLVNWATKLTHLLDTHGVDTVKVDLPLSWLGAGLLLGAAWSGIAWDDDADAIITDDPDTDFDGEIFLVGASDDPTVVSVDAEILAQPDDALLPVPDLVPHGPVQIPDCAVKILSNGVVLDTAETRFDADVWQLMRGQWARLNPVVFVDAELDSDQVARIIETERLD